LLSEPDTGLYDAMNKGLALARGEFIAYVGADDHLAPGALQAVAKVIQDDPGVQIVCGATKVLGPDGGWHEPASPLVRRHMPQRAPARHQSIFVRTQDLQAAGGFDTNYRIAADYDAYLNLVEAGVQQRLIPETLSEFRLGGASSRDALATARDYRDVRIAHGANPLVEGAVMWKSALGAQLHAAGMKARDTVGGRRA
jgi:glycosyltransferase involved in cell wall biosynthesis